MDSPSQCTGSTENCSCVDHLHLNAFKKFDWFLMMNSSSCEPFLTNNESLPTEHLNSLKCHRQAVGEEQERVKKELYEVQNVLEKLEAENATATNEEFCREKERFRKLQGQGELLKRLTCQYASLLSPIRRLSSEIIQDIFILVSILQDEDILKESLDFYSTDSEPLSFPNGPTALRAVCKAWREVALGLPDLWTELCLKFDPMSSERTLSCLKRIDDSLQRAKSRGLRIKLLQNDHSEGQYSSEISKVVRHLMTFSPRFVELDLVFESSSDLLGFLRLSEGCAFTSLKSLRVSVTEWDRGLSMCIFKYFLSASSLVALELIGILHVENNLQNLPIPWSQLETLRGDEVSDPEDEIKLLRLCSSLKEFQLVDATLIQGYEEACGRNYRSSSTIQHQNLVTLNIADAPLLGNITLPTLQSLTTDAYLDKKGLAQLQKFISRSDCHLTCLEIGEVNSPIPLALLRLLPSIRVLKIGSELETNGTVTEGLITHLSKSGEVLLPSLQHLELPEAGISWGEVVEPKWSTIEDCIKHLMKFFKVRMKAAESTSHSPLEYVLFQHPSITGSKKDVERELNTSLYPYRRDFEKWLEQSMFVLKQGKGKTAVRSWARKDDASGEFRFFK